MATIQYTPKFSSPREDRVRDIVIAELQSTYYGEGELESMQSEIRKIKQFLGDLVELLHSKRIFSDSEVLNLCNVRLR